MSKRRWPVLTLLFVILIVMATGCSSTTSSSKEEPTPTPIPPPAIPEKPTYTVKQGEVVDSLSFTGRVAPAIEEELFFSTSGRAKVVYVERNDQVTEGTVLAELENDDLIRQLAQADIELETAELNLKKAEDAHALTVEKASIDLEIKRLGLEKTKENLAGLERDVEVAAIELAQAKAGPTDEEIEISLRGIERSKNSLWSAQVSRDSTCGQGGGAACDSAQANVQSAEESLRIAEINHSLLIKPLTADELTVLEAGYEKVAKGLRTAELDYEIQKYQFEIAQLEFDNLTSELDSQLLKAVERAKLSVERLQAMVDDTQVISPIDGKVTSVSAYEGRDVQAYRTVFVVADETELEITAEPMSSQLQRLTEGMDAAVILSAYPGKELPATIVQLPYPYGKGGGATIEDADKLTHITMDTQDLDVEAGDLVKVIVTIERKADALWLPPAAIRTFSGRKFVVVEEDGRQRRVDVTVGIESAERVEIEDGLEAGQVVIGQ